MASRKRSLLPDVYKQKRRCLIPVNKDVSGELVNEHAWDVPTDTKASLLFLKISFPQEKFEDRIPPIVMKHQLYSIIHNRTIVDKHVNDLRESGDVKLFRLGADADESCIVFTEDYQRHCLRVMADLKIDQAIIDKFTETIVKKCKDISLDKETLINTYLFTDKEITELIKSSVLTVRDVGSWWLAIPNAGVFMKSFVKGRKFILTMLRKCKYKQVLQKELEQRKWPKLARLGIMYHVNDIIGADLVVRVQTTSGVLLRLKD
ncbi:serine/threonine-protein kinase 19 [Patella vulgata]|uniref:serine/threonine-protein kinase 19 n=1 Tax=Patella vulgata TaxID=6465 RepID=UPI00217FEDC1|nr:serine/threonine-protein kinase 19 [Patella vulgata]XP_050393448.1 serine/threonine-protein kinase 19 [Patella vulgata]